MKRYKIHINRIYTTVILLLFLLASCVDEQIVNKVPLGNQIIVEMTIPGLETPTIVTRSIADDAGEAQIHTLDMLIFDKSSPARLIRHLKIDNFSQNTSSDNYEVEFHIALEEDRNAGSIVVIANAANEVAAVIPDGIIDLPKQDILADLVFKTSPRNGSYNWNASSPGYTPIPMYGETSISGIFPGSRISGIELMRMLARIDVNNRVDGSIFELREIYLVNTYPGGYIAPAWNPSDGVLLNEDDEHHPYSKNLDPMIPPSIDKIDSNDEGAIRYFYNQDVYRPGIFYAGEIYTYEQPKSGVKDGACLILRGNYRGEDTYYRVDFVADKSCCGDDYDQANRYNREYIPLYRNHKYIVTITDAEGIGYGTLSQAINSSTVLSNLKTSIIVVDMTGIKNIVYDGQYFMGTESRMIDVPWNIDREIRLRVSSDYHGHWHADVLNPNSTTWLRFPNGNAAEAGTDINSTGLTFHITPSSSYWGNGDYVKGQIAFTAGRLRDTLTIRRLPMAMMFARSNVVSLNGKLTFAVTEEDNQRIPANSQGVYFKWGSLLALAPAGNPYDPANHFVYNPTVFSPESWGGGLEGWDQIPYAHSNFYFVTPPFTGSDMDAFKGYEYDESINSGTGVGDICRFITRKDDWIEGKWRLPSYRELELLYEETPTKSIKGSFINRMEILNTNSSSYRNGNFLHDSGVMLGIAAAMSTPTNQEIKTPPEGTTFFPASGYRYPNGDGDAVQPGAYGAYWTSTPYDEITVYYLFISKNGAMFYEADRSYAYPVRCIRDY